jgi:hypothetical protein
MQKSIITLLLLTSAAAFANEAADERTNRTAFTGERARAEVRTEIQRARQDGTLSQNEDAAAMKQAPQIESRSRSDIRAEAVQAARLRVVHEQI